MNPNYRRVFCISLAIFLVTGCSASPASNQSNLSASQNNSQAALWVTTDPNASPTPTPFQPSDAVASVDLKGTAFPGSTPTSVVLPPVDGTPTKTPYINRYPKPDGQVNILILGSDFRPNAGYRTDVMLLLSINTKQNTAAIVSFPRDLYVDIPGWEMQRINTAQAHGGFSLTQATFVENFGVKRHRRLRQQGALRYLRPAPAGARLLLRQRRLEPHERRHRPVVRPRAPFHQRL